VEQARLVLVPNFTELEWVIRPRLEEWAEVLVFDPPGVGEEPISAEDRARILSQGGMRELVVRRGLERIEELGWDRYVVVADGEGNGAAALIAAERPGAVAGIALGHACLSYAMEGDRPAVTGEVWAALRALLGRDYERFIRTGIVQLTQGSYADELAERIVERARPEISQALWDAIGDDPVDIGALLGEVDAPLLLSEHAGCLMWTPEGFADARAAFREAQAYSFPEPATISEAFAGALRSFCTGLDSG
jgi:hypothetical protein